MARDYFQDITPVPEQEGGTDVERPRSIRNIAPSGNRPRMSRPGFGMNPTGGERPRKRRSSLVIWGIAILALAGLAFLAVTLFLHTTVTVVPRTHQVIFDKETIFTAYPQDSTTVPVGALVYTTDSKSFDASVPVTASGTEQVSIGASGSITIYNNYSATPQRLIKNTRFETPDGKVFRIRDSVIVPGKGASGPGTISATVYADEPGADYNIGPVAKFTLPGLKGTADMYANIYASSAAPMTGGFVGTRPSIAQSAKDAAQSNLVAALKSKIADAYTDTSSGYALIPLASITYSDLVTDVNADGSASASEHATVVMPVIARATLDGFLAQETSATTGAGSIISIQDPSTFSFSVASDTQPSLGTNAVDFSITGKALFVWQVDTKALAQDLAGKNRAVFETVVSGYPAIDSASAKIYPLWSQSFPSDPTAIQIIVTAPAGS